ncbi:iron chelate uptake ABC transporter family permease subunit [Lentzea sp. NPDC003310]|uniref:FecCD family ABC transporter permease n=1 Tax=Lentzea sp. NPDC003310 TaxID=3154447 RepID=UPI0033A0844A
MKVRARSLRVGATSFRVRPRPLLVVAASLVVLAALLVVDVMIGDFPLTATQVVDVLLGGGTRRDQFVVMELRMPRALTGLLVGGALGLSGAIFQAIVRNPLASPDLLGVTWGAGVGAVTVITFAGSLGVVTGSAASVGVPLAALLGGLFAGLLVYGLAWRQGIEGFRMVLVGIGITAVASSFTHYLLTVGDVLDAGRAMVWITGSLNGRGWEHVVPVGIALAVLIPTALIGGHVLGALQFDDQTARGLGIRVDAARSFLIIVAIVLASVATAGAGPIAFVALAAPQIALRLSGTAQPPLFGSVVVGGALVMLSDLVARTIYKTELPVGVVTAVLGAPYLMFLLIRSRREARV